MGTAVAVAAMEVVVAMAAAAVGEVGKAVEVLETEEAGAGKTVKM